MSEEKKEKEKSKAQSAKEIAKIMAANMAANMKDPDFLMKKERRLQHAANKVLREYKLTEEKKQEQEKDKNKSAEEIAEIMAANMAANMNNPNFIEEQELLSDKIRAKIIKERKLREQKKKSEND